MAYVKSDKFIKELFELLPPRYQIGFQTSMRVSNLIFDSVYSFH